MIDLMNHIFLFLFFWTTKGLLCQAAHFPTDSNLIQNGNLEHYQNVTICSLDHH